MQTKNSLIVHFSNLQDPRIGGKTHHKLIDLIVVAVCATIAGAENWVEIEQFCEARKDWFRQFLELSGGVPSHDTFGRVFERIDPDQFNKIFMNWVQETNVILKGQIISIDGKALKGTKRVLQRKMPLHIVSAWATESSLVLGQKKAQTKNHHEPHIMEELLSLLKIKGCIVTMDAIAAIPKICNTTVNRGGDFVISLKRNKKFLHLSVSEAFVRYFADNKNLQNYYEEERHHGREEKRDYYIQYAIR